MNSDEYKREQLKHFEIWKKASRIKCSYETEDNKEEHNGILYHIEDNYVLCENCLHIDHFFCPLCKKIISVDEGYFDHESDFADVIIVCDRCSGNYFDIKNLLSFGRVL